LKCVRHLPIITPASSLLRNHSTLRHSSLTLPLKLLHVPFCHGLPGSIRPVWMPSSVIHLSSASDTNSGSLSERRTLGGPRSETRRGVDHTTRADRSGDIDRQALARALIDHRQTLDLMVGRDVVEHEVIGGSLC
jgi:hypothetical protein